MKKHAKRILLIDVPHPLYFSLRYYLLKTYPGYRLTELKNSELRNRDLKRLNPHLIILPGNIRAADFSASKKTMAAIRNCLDRGTNFLGICNGLYNSIEGHVEVPADKGALHYSRAENSLKIIDGGYTMHWELDQELVIQRMGRTVAAPNGTMMKTLYLNGPRMAQINRHCADTFPVLSAIDKRGDISGDIAEMTATKLSGGGRAVLSGVHFESPIRTTLDVIAEMMRHAEKQGDANGLAYVSAEYSRMQRAYDLHLKYYEKENARLRDYVYEELLGLER